ncbi:conserved hypothetical protein [Desulfamplus magnetovallimortis]|uniref:Alanine racemase N-terminal domain-containing protein n=1 Tax=Desulfamplus magnetovallimortis TaxID=1246637 RepID=A0A1W1H6X6_9BACT|nr:conserved hypothetical protein [Desulfamplus magnetovallimortis]
MTTNSINDRLHHINQEIKNAAIACGRKPDDITLIAVSKKKSVEAIRDGIAAGVSVLGENYIQEAVDKIDVIGNDNIFWHFIGHLQTNKARFAVKYFDMIHTVDTLKLAKEISKQAEKIGKVQYILMQVNISEELSKSGTSSDKAVELAREISLLGSVSLQGLMGMPPFFDDPEKARPYFKRLVEIKKTLMQQLSPEFPCIIFPWA